ncbi:Ribosomal protein L41 [Artemisia annua]|uniref:Ribosomal protein L41 n=1 Tax=Artemisia annua TaxID=35608 RepID=A0A2U1L750_ARTAN|nr:Ribosomal protein L41 [Artemisia annua]
MTDHLLPWMRCARRMTSSSSGVKGRCLTLGLSWLHQRRRHDLPDLPGILDPITDQFLAPCASTNCISLASSSGVHDPFLFLNKLTSSFDDDDVIVFCFEKTEMKCEEDVRWFGLL